MSLAYFVLVVTVLASVAANPFETVSGLRQPSRVKRQVGSEVLQNPDDPQYKKLAKEAYSRWTQLNSSILKNIIVAKVTKQVVAGFIYRLRFIAFTETLYGNPRKVVLLCNSKVLDNVNNQKEFNTNCMDVEDKQQTRIKRQDFGGEEEKDTEDPEYRLLAIESYEKYIRGHNDEKIIPTGIIVTRATYQVVSGSLKRLQFVVLTKREVPFSLVCHSKIWEQSWLNKKDIDVDCIRI